MANVYIDFQTSVFETSVFETSVFEISVFETSVFETSVFESSVFETSVVETSVLRCFSIKNIRKKKTKAHELLSVDIPSNNNKHNTPGPCI